MKIRPIEQHDVPRILEIVTAAGNFSPQEIATAIEVVEEGLADPESGYFTFVLEDEQGGVAGYECHGPTPLTLGTFDLYWIAVDPGSQGSGYGRELLRFAEGDVRSRGGRLLLIETSSQESYSATIRFYERSGYPLVARIPDFYKPHDDKLIFAKALS